MKSNRFSFLAVSLVLFLSVLACTINLGGPKYPTQSVPVSTESVGNLQDALGTAEADAAVTGTLTVSITEAQLTSYLASRLQTQSSVVISNPQIYLQDGQIQLYGTVQQGNFQVTASAILSAGVDDQGQVKITLTSADFGPIPVPQNVRDAITSSIQEAFTGAVGPVATGIRLESITVANGTMTIVGRTK